MESLQKQNLILILIEFYLNYDLIYIYIYIYINVISNGPYIVMVYYINDL